MPNFLCSSFHISFTSFVAFLCSTFLCALFFLLHSQFYFTCPSCTSFLSPSTDFITYHFLSYPNQWLSKHLKHLTHLSNLSYSYSFIPWFHPPLKCQPVDIIMQSLAFKFLSHPFTYPLPPNSHFNFIINSATTIKWSDSLNIPLTSLESRTFHFNLLSIAIKSIWLLLLTLFHVCLWISLC